MAIDTPATIAVLGAGPIGLEAALYGRFLGYDVVVLEQREVLHHVRRWGHVRMFSPFGLNRSPLGLAALHAQDPDYRPPSDAALLTGHEWIERYLLPLARTDLLDDHVRTETAAVAVGRPELLKTDMAQGDERIDSRFRILVRTSTGSEDVVVADAVLDTTGVFSQPNWLGPGGAPALGEARWRSAIQHGLPDVAGVDRARYARRHTLVVGSGFSAATNVVALAKLAASEPATNVTWITRRPSAGSDGPMARIPDDRFPERDALARTANELVATGKVTHWCDTIVESLQRDDAGSLLVRTSGEHQGEHAFDELIASVGYRPDVELTRELQVHACYATEGPMRLAAALARQAPSGGAPVDCLDQAPCGPASLVTTEPDFYVLGAKSYGRTSSFLFARGLDQIREIFTIIGDRESLDLYATIGNRGRL